MSTPPVLIAAWARTAVVPRGQAFQALQAHEIAAPVLHQVLQRAGLPGAAVDAVVLGNALGQAATLRACWPCRPSCPPHAPPTPSTPSAAPA